VSLAIPETLSEPALPAAPAALAVPFEQIYATHFDFVWRNVRRLGVSDGQVDDAVQEVFLVLYRRRADFEGRASLRTWLFRILVRVAADQRRSARRKSPLARQSGEAIDVETVPDQTASPHEETARREAVAVLHRLLEDLDDDKRAVFVLAELEQMAMPEIAEALGVNLNTAYARLRAARRDFERALARVQARDTWRTS
jgi:RNA polymerase sigma-70 factor, ECF subfamily